LASCPGMGSPTVMIGFTVEPESPKAWAGWLVTKPVEKSAVGLFAGEEGALEFRLV
jgi:hypothetical protein